ncbi:MAG: phage antirepressor KilAC domain-containing protein [Schwartzia sp.]|nr:phage antirepressor KilAC domain-containing protein [Schwartzia sp. (in: firmicutes)]
MNELIKINEENKVDGRELHDFLQIGTAYKDWFPRMVEYGFVEGVDFNSLKNEQVRTEGNREVRREVTTHLMTIGMAKEICMIQRNERGKQARQYFIECEKRLKALNPPLSPEEQMAQGLLAAKKLLDQAKLELTQAKQLVHELQPKATYYDLVLQNKSLLSVTKIAKDYGKSAIWLNTKLHEYGIQFKQGDQWFLYQWCAQNGYTQSDTHVIDDTHSRMNTKWTQKGRLFIYDTLKSHGILPLIEQDGKSA